MVMSPSADPSAPLGWPAGRSIGRSQTFALLRHDPRKLNSQSDRAQEL